MNAIPVFLEQAPLDAGTIVTYRVFPGRYVRAVHDPAQHTATEVEGILLARYAVIGPAVSSIIHIGGHLALAPLPAGEPLRIEPLGGGRTRTTLDLAQCTLGQAQRLIVSARAQSDLNRLLAEHDVTLVPADGPNGQALDGPMFVRGGRFLMVPPGTDPADTLAYVRDAFAHQQNTEVTA